MARFSITVNGEPHQLAPEDAASVEALLRSLAVASKRGVAVALDDEVVPRSRWAETAVQDGARVEIIQATQGG